MARTTYTAVTTVIQTSLAQGQVEALIDDANLWVTEYLSDAGFSTARLTAIEKYLACHFVTLRDPRLTSTQLKNVRESYQRDAKMSEYLKAAISFDSTGAVKQGFAPAGDTYAGTYRVGTRYVDDTTS